MWREGGGGGGRVRDPNVSIINTKGPMSWIKGLNDHLQKPTRKPQKAELGKTKTYLKFKNVNIRNAVPLGFSILCQSN